MYAIRSYYDMATENKEISTAESLRDTRTYGKFRCHNPSCMERIQPEKGSKTAKCPTCVITSYSIHYTKLYDAFQKPQRSGNADNNRIGGKDSGYRYRPDKQGDQRKTE